MIACFVTETLRITVAIAIPRLFRLLGLPAIFEGSAPAGWNMQDSLKWLKQGSCQDMQEPEAAKTFDASDKEAIQRGKAQLISTNPKHCP